MADYLELRRNLAGVVLLVDPRHGLTELDQQLLELVSRRASATASVKLLVLLTKADKLNRKEGAEALRAAQDALGEFVTDEADVGVALFSALKRTGSTTWHSRCAAGCIRPRMPARRLAEPS